MINDFLQVGDTVVTDRSEDALGSGTDGDADSIAQYAAGFIAHQYLMPRDVQDALLK